MYARNLTRVRQFEFVRTSSHLKKKSFFLSSMLLYVHIDRTDYYGPGAQDIHLDFYTAPGLRLLFSQGVYLSAKRQVEEGSGWLGGRGVQNSSQPLFTEGTGVCGGGGGAHRGGEALGEEGRGGGGGGGGGRGAGWKGRVQQTVKSVAGRDGHVETGLLAPCPGPSFIKSVSCHLIRAPVPPAFKFGPDPPGTAGVGLAWGR